jgi:thiol-disulfide isomerase/thioredoxin
MSINSFGQTGDLKKPVSASEPSSIPILKAINFNQLQSLYSKNDNKLYVINFWATWCKPCVEELPEFMEVNKIYNKNPRFKMILVSLDLASEINTKVKPFILKNKIGTDVFILDDNKRMNEWIPAIDINWSGAIPATVFYLNGKKIEFNENKMQKNELIQIINKYI